MTIRPARFTSSANRPQAKSDPWHSAPLPPRSFALFVAVAALAGCGVADNMVKRADAQTTGTAPIQWDLKNAKVIDLSHVQETAMPADPSLKTPVLTYFARVGQGSGAFWNLENITYTPHTGTHMDTPFHVNNNWGAAETVDPTFMIGPASVIAIPAVAGHAITAAEIKAWEAANGPIQEGDGILLHTGFDANWPNMQTYIANGYPTLAKDAAEYLVSKKARYVGLETISPDGPNTDTHRILLGNNVLILENLTGIGKIGKSRCWTLGTFPNIKGASGVYIRLLAVVNK